MKRYSERQEMFVRNNIRKHTYAEVTNLFNKKYSVNFTSAQIHSFAANHRINSGRTGCFQKGHRPWNAGTKGKGLTGRNRGSFKKGNVPVNRRPVGHERIDSKDGYIMIKVRERNPYTGAPTRFKQKHVVLWEKRNGPVPRGKVIIFRNGNIYNFRPGNLVCVSKAEHARLNQMHYREHPKELKPSILALAKLKTRIGELKKRV